VAAHKEMRMRAALIVMVGLTALVPALAGDAAADLKKMAGDWKTVVHEANGMVTPKELLEKTAGKLVVTGDRYKVFLGDFSDEGSIKLDAGKTPKQIDVVTAKGEKMQGIYKFDGEDMTICFAQPGGERPSEFKTKEGTGQILLKYQRLKK
jgi:uncharacterized protein (TIGR03067 family)